MKLKVTVYKDFRLRDAKNSSDRCCPSGNVTSECTRSVFRRIFRTYTIRVAFSNEYLREHSVAFFTRHVRGARCIRVRITKSAACMFVVYVTWIALNRKAGEVNFTTERVGGKRSSTRRAPSDRRETGIPVCI